MSNLRGEKVSLRPIQSHDLPQIILWGSDEEISRLADGDYPQSIAEGEEWLRDIAGDRYRKYFGIIFENQLIGDIELDHIAWRSGDAELRIRIGRKDLWNRGLGTDAVETMLKYAFLRLNLRRVYLRVYAHNRRALRCYSKSGFCKEGKLASPFGKIFLMRITRSEYLASAAPSTTAV
ncbi:MAG TPA: GNAT family N-acetyltransferase [Firmicutes bacterium]|jgi:RimJ/RimL family protein N-acetyltransferase|nr:GNAT family N-acetyltransferase [Bacillota bacterium]